jgi:ribosomal protein S18 acetylase RimI-like enzyme
MFGDPLTTANAPEAIALWLLLDEAAETPEEDFKASIHEILSILGRDAFARLMPVLNLAARFNQKCAPGRHLYLQFLGVEPTRQGLGLGSTLIRPMLARADAESLPCYLETSDARNVPLYQSHGFTITVEEVEPNSAIRGWGFLRA